MFTMHGTTMIFLVAMPVLTGFGVYLVPLMIGANEMALPRLGALSFWLQLFGGLLLYFSFATGAAPDAGWFSYAPLSEKAFSPGAGLDYWALALLMIAAGSIGSAINLIVTIATERAPGMTMRLVPLFVWMTLVTSVMIVFALPALGGVAGDAAERPAVPRAFLRSRRRAARRCCGSIISGFSDIPRFTSWCFRRSG